VAKVNGHLRGKQPKLNRRQEAHLYRYGDPGAARSAERSAWFSKRGEVAAQAERSTSADPEFGLRSVVRLRRVAEQLEADPSPDPGAGWVLTRCQRSSGSPRWRPWVLHRDGHGFSAGMATGVLGYGHGNSPRRVTAVGSGQGRHSFAGEGVGEADAVAFGDQDMSVVE
jgi:hypothetical protein